MCSCFLYRFYGRHSWISLVCTDKIRQFCSFYPISALLPFHVDFQLGLGIECSRFQLFSGSLKMQLHPSDFGSRLVESKWVLLPDGSVELQNPQNTFVQPCNKVICHKYDTYVQRAEWERNRGGGGSCSNFARILFLFFVEWCEMLQKFCFFLDSKPVPLCVKWK